jgi:hypothetical protein
LEIEGKRSQLFCICTHFFAKEPPKELIDYVCEKTAKPRDLSDEIAEFASPEIERILAFDGLSGVMTLTVRRPILEVRRRIMEIRRRKLNPKSKKELALIEEEIGEKLKKAEKPEEFMGFFKLEITTPYGVREIMKLGKMQKLLNRKEIKSALDLIERCFPKPLRITTCAVYQFEASAFKPVGGFLFPTEIPMPSELTARFGSSELESYGLRFKNSSVGIESLLFRLQDDNTLELSLRASYELSQLKDMLVKSYETVNGISDFLVQKVR